MRNHFISEIPDSVRDHLSRQDVEQLDSLFDEIDAFEVDYDDDDELYGDGGLRLN